MPMDFRREKRTVGRPASKPTPRYHERPQQPRPKLLLTRADGVPAFFAEDATHTRSRDSFSLARNGELPFRMGPGPTINASQQKRNRVFCSHAALLGLTLINSRLDSSKQRSALRVQPRNSNRACSSVRNSRCFQKIEHLRIVLENNSKQESRAPKLSGVWHYNSITVFL